MTTSRTPPLLQNFGMRVRHRRRELGISQEELAHRAGLHRSYIGDIERGGRNVSLTNIVRLATALDTTAAVLLHNVNPLSDESGRSASNRN